ncbi:9663_t:CDS:2, partial [Acaulospora morrowiae]
SPDRVVIIKNYLSQFRDIFEFHNPSDHGLDSILSVHDVDYIEYLKTAYTEWCNEGGDRNGVIPETFAHSKILNTAKNLKTVKSSLAKAGIYCFDLSCCITEDTWGAVYESAQVCISAAKELLNYNLERSGDIGVFALCRPPGHHANSNVCGGYCFLNNVAIATKLLIYDNSDEFKNQNKVVILDIDYHHGNGTQDIFYSQSNPLYVSFHASNDYPYFTGDESEVGSGEGEGFNINIPLPKETNDEEYVEKLKVVIQSRIIPYNANYLIVSLGVDTYKDDPIAGFGITTLG